METLKCRTYARKNLRERKIIVDDLEEKLREKRTRLNTILFHNDRIREVSITKYMYMYIRIKLQVCDAAM